MPRYRQGSQERGTARNCRKITPITPKADTPLRTINMLLPISVMVVMIFVGLLVTGEGTLSSGVRFNGSPLGSTRPPVSRTGAAVLYSSQRLMNIREITEGS